MIENRLKKCCLNCPHSEVETQQHLRRHACDEYPTKDTKIFCKHEAVCKAYYEETEVTTDENTCSDK